MLVIIIQCHALPRPIINKRPGYEVSVHTVMRELKVAQSEVPVVTLVLNPGFPTSDLSCSFGDRHPSLH